MAAPRKAADFYFCSTFDDEVVFGRGDNRIYRHVGDNSEFDIFESLVGEIGTLGRR